MSRRTTKRHDPPLDARAAERLAARRRETLAGLAGLSGGMDGAGGAGRRGSRSLAARVGRGVAGALAGRVAGRALAPVAGRAARRYGVPVRTLTRAVEVAAPVVISFAMAGAARRKAREQARRSGPGGRARRDAEPPGAMALD